MTLGEVLLYRTNVDDIVLFVDGGWQIGCTIIDHEDLFSRSINHKLWKSEVIDYHYISQDWTTKRVMEVNIANNKEETKVKRQGFFTGKIYDENYPLKDIRECCKLISDKECTEELNKTRAKILKSKCIGCPSDKDCLKYAEIEKGDKNDD